MATAPDLPDDLLSNAATCRRIAEGMGRDPLAESLIEIAEDYEPRAVASPPELDLAVGMPNILSPANLQCGVPSPKS